MHPLPFFTQFSPACLSSWIFVQQRNLEASRYAAPSTANLQSEEVWCEKKARMGMCGLRKSAIRIIAGAMAECTIAFPGSRCDCEDEDEIIRAFSPQTHFSCNCKCVCLCVFLFSSFEIPSLQFYQQFFPLVLVFLSILSLTTVVCCCCSLFLLVSSY